MSKIGVITIGQSPREDIRMDLEKLLPSREIVERGALDGLSPEEIRRLAPRAGEFPLVTRLRDSTTVVIGKESLSPLVARTIRELDGLCDAILILCSGQFPEFQSRVPVIYPSRELERALRRLAPQSAVVLVPHEGQIEPANRRFGTLVPQVQSIAVSPYPWNCPEISAGFIIMDCMGYSLAMEEEIQDRTRARVLSARSISAAAALEL